MSRRSSTPSFPPRWATGSRAWPLFAEDRGLALIRRIAAAVPGRLIPGGWLLCEIGAEQGEEVAAICRQAGLAEIQVLQDYCRRDRVVAARLAP